ncbi:sugar phosphate isomerase/epimerase [bacterium]|nr:sugar phosphate isomerase/epimerase [bacterium]
MKKTTAGAMAGAAFGSTFLRPGEAVSQPFKGQIKKSLYYGMLPDSLSATERIQLAKRAGFEGVEIPTIEQSELLAEIKQAALTAGIKVHSIMNQRHWKFPLSSSDPDVIKQSMEGMETSLRNAKEIGADTVLLVPAVVNPETSYKDAYERSQTHIKELLPLAKELNIIIAVENVWNKFLLSPLEFARYVDEMNSPFLKAYFDCGNIALYGYPHDWIRTLGKRIVKVHIKGFDVNKKEFTNLGDGTIDWLEIRRAFSDIGYSGYMGAELKGGDEVYLKDVSARMDKIIAGQKIVK